MKVPGWLFHLLALGQRTPRSRTWGTVLHATAGAAIGVVSTLLGVHQASTLALLALGGWLREVWQHDFYLSWHQWVEATGWWVGGIVGMLALWSLTQ